MNFIAKKSVIVCRADISIYTPGMCAHIGCMCMDVYVCRVYKYTVNTLWRCISSADIPAARQDQFFHPSFWTIDTAAPPPTSLPYSMRLCVCMYVCVCTDVFGLLKTVSSTISSSLQSTLHGGQLWNNVCCMQHAS